MICKHIPSIKKDTKAKYCMFWSTVTLLLKTDGSWICGIGIQSVETQWCILSMVLIQCVFNIVVTLNVFS